MLQFMGSQRARLNLVTEQQHDGQFETYNQLVWSNDPSLPGPSSKPEVFSQMV